MNMNSTSVITIFTFDLWLKNHTRIQYHFSGICIDKIWLYLRWNDIRSFYKINIRYIRLNYV